MSELCMEKNIFVQTNSADHLGIKQESNLKITNRIIERCQKAISAQGLHPYGLNMITSISLYKKIVIPFALYGSELWKNMSSSEIAIVYKLQH